MDQPKVFFAKWKAVLQVQRQSGLRKEKTALTRSTWGRPLSSLKATNFMCIMLVMPELEQDGLSIYVCMITRTIEKVYISTYRGLEEEIIMKYYTGNV